MWSWLKRIFRIEPPPPGWHAIQKYMRGYEKGAYDCSQMAATIVAWYRIHRPEVNATAQLGIKRFANHAWVRIENAKRRQWFVDPTERSYSRKRPRPEVGMDYYVISDVEDAALLTEPEWQSPYFARDENGDITVT